MAQEHAMSGDVARGIAHAVDARLPIPVVTALNALGATRAKELMFTNRSLSATEALACGLVNRVVPDDELEHATEALVAEFSDGCTSAPSCASAS